MILLEELSNIGFGTYRISAQSQEHADALHHAVSSGCNLIDTASNYGNGEAEKMVGRLLRDTPGKDLFIITKAGYISGDNLRTLEDLHSRGKGKEDLVHLSDDFKHSIHPDYLEAQIGISLQRLQRRYIDGFLLHSPEYFFDKHQSPDAKEEYYTRIKKAFEFLEEKVQQGTIRYYGVSSNTLPYPDRDNGTDVLRLTAAARSVATGNHFKLLQFPYNIIEGAATNVPYYVDKTLVDIARKEGLITFANRPLNANTKKGALRLAIHDLDAFEFDTPKDTIAGGECFFRIEQQLKKLDDAYDLSVFPAIASLKDNWMNIPGEEAFTRIFFGSFYPFIDLIYEHNTSEETLSFYRLFQDLSWKYCLKNMTTRTIEYLTAQKLERLLPSSPVTSLSGNLCMEYLDRGIDHILVGMRKTKYVDHLKDLF